MLISVITVCKNAEMVLSSTLASVLIQDMDDYEVIVIDGKSTDGTVAVIENFKKRFEDQKIKFTFVSEADMGLYDGMNKGIEMASGKWIFFLNAGDMLYRTDTFMQSAKILNSTEADVIYGDVENCYPDSNKIVCAKPAIQMKKKMVFNHQCAFTRKELFDKMLFDCGYREASDYDFYLHMYLAGYKFEQIPLVIVSYDCTHPSPSERYMRLHNEYRAVQKANGVWRVTIGSICYHVYILFRYYIGHKCIKRIANRKK